VHGVAQRQPAREPENDAGQHAVARADCAASVDRDRCEALASLRGCQQRSLGAERENEDLAAALLDDLPVRQLLVAFVTDLALSDLQFAKARF
jgi:hypothetical protein